MKTPMKSIVDFADGIKHRALVKELATVTNSPIVQEYCSRRRLTIALRDEMLMLDQKRFEDAESLISYAQAELNARNLVTRKDDVSGWTHAFHLVILVLFAIGLAECASAKDAKAYQTGVISSVERSTGWIDTTRCSGPTGYVQCDGGIQNTSEDVRTLTTVDGQKFVIHHQMGRPNTVKGVADGTQVQYRWERHMGVDVLLIVVPGNSKEGWYYKEGRK